MKKMSVILLVIIFTLTGCNFPGTGKSTPPPKSDIGQGDQKEQPKEQKQDYYIGIDVPVKGINEWVDRYKPYEGVLQQKMDDYRTVLVSMGEKFSAGYKVSVDKVTKEEDRWLVNVSFEKPEQEDYSGTTVYPYALVSIIDDGKPIQVIKTTVGQQDQIKLNVIEIPEGKKLAASKNFIIFTPLENQLIPNPVRIQGKARVFEATFRITIEDGHNQLAEKIVMADEGGPGWGNFDVSLAYNQSTNPSGFIIFSFENMETGQQIEELMLPVKF